MTKKILTLSIALLLSLSINAQDWWGNGKRIKGNGNVITKTRTVDTFDKIGVGGSFDVLLVKGKEGRISIKGEENIIPYIVTEIKGNTLKISYKKNTNINTTRRLTITVSFEDIEGIALGGSGNLTSEDLIKADDLSVSLGGSGNIKIKIDTREVSSSIGGSGNIKLSGKSKELTCSIAGSGSIRAYDLTVDSVIAKIAGSGSIKTTVKNKIKAKVVGSGSVYYKGNPTHIDTKSVGSGDVIDRN
jgi:hypothetical protein